MLKLLIVLSVATVVFAGSRINKYDENGRIVGGEIVEAGDIPFQVSIHKRTGQQYCGGSIISPDWIVTAAQCSDYLDTSEYLVRAGSLNYATGGTAHIVDRIYIHPDFTLSTFKCDIALWKVIPPFTWDNVTAPVNLPAQGEKFADGTMAWVSGWGTTASTGLPSQSLRKADVPLVNLAECEAAYNGNVAPYQICAGYMELGGKDACSGDGGGPLYLDESDTLIGIVSWGNIECAKPGYPGIYTEVSVFRDWIFESTGV